MVASVASRTQIREKELYRELRTLISKAGLLDPQPVYYWWKTLFTFSMLACAIWIFLNSQEIVWVRILDAAFLAFAMTQLALIGHDVGHYQVAGRGVRNIVLGHLLGNVAMGLSSEWWRSNHDIHHAQPNRDGVDPHINIPVLAFTSSQVGHRARLLHLIIQHQAQLLFPILALAFLNMHVQSIMHVLKRRAPNPLIEGMLIAIHLGLSAWLFFPAFGFSGGIAYFLFVRALGGLYMGSIFATNHKAMRVVDRDEELSFLMQQISLTRNIKSTPFIDFWYAGLNYQIEHHLFPGMPRNQLGKASRIIRPFCQAHGLPYHETTTAQSFREILALLQKVSSSMQLERA